MLLDRSGGPHIKYNKNGRRTLLTDNPDVIESRLLERLRSGIQTHYLGVFLLIPYLKHLKVEEYLPLLGIEKKYGIPLLKDLLLGVNQTVIGKPRFSKLKTMKDLGLAVASGLPAYPEQSHYHTFLSLPRMSAVDQFIRTISRRQFELGYLEGNELACDTHVAKYTGKIDLQKDHIPQEGKRHKAVRIYAVVDQGYRNPVYLSCGYPGTGAVEIGKRLVDASIDILPPDKKTKFIFDKWFSVGELLDYINQRGQRFITLIRRHQNRIEQMKKIPINQFKTITENMGITQIWVRLRNYEDDARLVVVEVYENGTRTVLGYLTNDSEADDLEIIQDYSSRWDVDFFYEEMDFLGLSALPSTKLNKVLFTLAIKLIAYNVISAFRSNLGDEFIEHEVETIFELFFDHQALVQLKRGKIMVTVFDHPYEYLLEDMYNNLSSKLSSKGVNPNVTWLGGYPLQFDFM